MIRISEKRDCCGCSACEAICPKQCIRLVIDEEGFLYPKVDETQCVNCGRCDTVCPVLNTEEERKKSIPKAYVAYSEHEQVRLESSSGGLFSMLAEAVIEAGGTVYGAAFDQEFQVHHIGVDNMDYLSELRGSKYVQSRMETVFQQAKEDLRDGRVVLFSGTACQIAGLNGYLGKKYQNLITIDVLCHGVPSPKVWGRYLDEVQKNMKSKVKGICFRQKDSGWKTYSVELQLENNRSYKKRFRRNPFMQLFLSDICLRPSCHDCRFKSINRCSDITLGDAWGVDQYMPEMDDDKGTSVVLIHSDKGKMLFEGVCRNIKYKEANADDIVPDSSDARNAVSANPGRAQFFQDLNQGISVHVLSKRVKPSIFERGYYKIGNILKKITH